MLHLLLLFCLQMTPLCCTYSHENIDELILIVNSEFLKVVQFFRQHKLSLHPLKTKFIVFSNSPVVKNMNIQLFINCNNDNEADPLKCYPISRVSPNDDIPAVHFLGVFFYQNLNFNYHLKVGTFFQTFKSPVHS